MTAIELIEPIEGRIPWMYLDTEGLVTAGVGECLETADEACAFFGRNVTSDYDRVAAMPKGMVAHRYWYAGCPTLTDAQIDPPAEDSRAVGSKLAALLVACLLLGSLGLTGCNDFERKTFQTLSASKALIDQAQIDYETGTLPHTQASYDAINKAKDAQTAAVRAFQVYETAKLTVNQNSDVTVQMAALNSALSSLGPMVAGIQHIYLGASK